jgi:hypothetical protein
MLAFGGAIHNPSPIRKIFPIKIEESKAIGDFPVTKSLKISPLLSALAGSVSNMK